MKKTVFILFLFVSAISSAQNKVWTLEECIRHAIENNPAKNRQEVQNKIYKINHREAIAGFLPSLSVSSGASFNYGRAIDDETNTYVSSNSFGNNYSVYSSLTLFDGFYQVYRTKIAKLYRLRGADQLQEMKDNISFDVMTLYFNVLYYKGTVDLAKKQLEESSFNLKRIERMEELGLKSVPDVAEIQAKEAEDRYRLTQQENFYQQEVLKLKDKMNLDIQEELAIAGYSAGYSLMEKEDPQEIYYQALNYLPAALAADKMLEITKKDYKVAQSNLYPNISMSAGWSTSFFRSMQGDDYIPFREQLDNKRSSYINFSLSIPIFSRLSRISSVKRSKQNVIIQESYREETLRQLYNDIEKTVADVNGLSDQRIQAAKRTEAAEEAHKTNIRKYEEGLINAIELTTSSNRLLSAEIEELYVQLQYQVKYKLLQYYKGKPIY